MKIAAVLLFLFLLAPLLAAEDHCPPGGQMKNGTNPEISWTSYMIKTDHGICVERTVHTVGQTYVNWPAAEMNGLWVKGNWTTERCCFSDSTLKDADLEYGVLGRKLHTAVYQGYNELADNEIFSVTGQIQAGDTVLPVAFSATSVPTNGPGAKRYSITIVNSKSPLKLKWDPDTHVQISPGDAGKPGELKLESGTMKNLYFAAKSPGAKDHSISVVTEGGKVLQEFRIPTGS